MPPDLKITIADIREAGHCARMRGWFQQQALYDEFRKMVKGGSIDAEKLLATGDPRALNVVSKVMKREGLTDG